MNAVNRGLGPLKNGNPRGDLTKVRAVRGRSQRGTARLCPAGCEPSGLEAAKRSATGRALGFPGSVTANVPVVPHALAPWFWANTIHLRYLRADTSLAAKLP